jgi:UrcA family protein
MHDPAAERSSISSFKESTMPTFSSVSAMTTQAATLVAALLAGGTFHTAAFAAEDVQEKAVHFADLDLTRPAGAEALYRRIRSAARSVCQTPGYDKNWSLVAEHACFDRAVERAVKSVDSPQLTRLHGDYLLRLARR